VGYCSNCNTAAAYVEKITVTVPATGHNYSDWEDTADGPSCTAAGTRRRICRNCKDQQTETVAALGHNWSDWQTTRNASCTAEGEKTRYCLRCQTPKPSPSP